MAATKAHLWRKAAAPVAPSPAFTALLAQLRDVSDGLETGCSPFIGTQIHAEDDDLWSRHRRGRMGAATIPDHL